ncbi:MAG: prepilin-type N-terminal cleavage/methylation domain-containing protein [Candidatus Zixiibacteriota bacterium]
MKSLFQSTRGITLIELLTAVVIIGIVSAMAVPRFQIAWERLSIRSADRNIISTVRLARSTAIATKEPHGVYFDGNALSITLFKDVANPSAFVFEPGDSVIRTDTLPVEFNFLGTDMTNDVLVFRPNGSAAFTGGGNISAMATTEKVVGILNHNVLASTGRIHSSSSFY